MGEFKKYMVRLLGIQFPDTLEMQNREGKNIPRESHQIYVNQYAQATLSPGGNGHFSLVFADGTEGNFIDSELEFVGDLFDRRKPDPVLDFDQVFVAKLLKIDRDVHGGDPFLRSPINIEEENAYVGQYAVARSIGPDRYELGFNDGAVGMFTESEIDRHTEDEHEEDEHEEDEHEEEEPWIPKKPTTVKSKKRESFIDPPIVDKFETGHTVVVDGGDYESVEGCVIGHTNKTLLRKERFLVIELRKGFDLVRDGELHGYASLILAHPDNCRRI